MVRIDAEGTENDSDRDIEFLIYVIVAFMMFPSCIDNGSALKRVGTSQYLQNGTFSFGID